MDISNNSLLFLSFSAPSEVLLQFSDISNLSLLRKATISGSGNEEFCSHSGYRRRAVSTSKK